MTKKELGASLRRGIVAGTVAGSLSGFAAFAAHAAIVPAPPAPQPVTGPDLPALPAAPSLAPLPNVRAVDAPSTVVLPAVRVTTVAPVTKTRSS